MIHYSTFILFFVLFLCNSCQENSIIFPKITEDSTKITFTKNPLPEKPIRFLALGDSYTIGQGINPEDTWCNQLANRLQNTDFQLDNVKIIARTGWTTQNLKDAILNEKPDSSYHLVSLLIGVNNQYQGRNSNEYRAEFEELVHTAIMFANNEKRRVFVLSIPDYGVTPFGSGFSGVSAEIQRFNNINREISAQYGISYFNITPISQQAQTDTSLLAPDKLHPSAKMYALWVDLIFDDIVQKLRE